MARIKVTNYQSVIEADLNIEGFTVLKGESNAGKSSFMKAVMATCYNRFRSGCVRFGEKESVIRIKFNDSPNILSASRSCTGGSPTYKLGSNGSIQTFEKCVRELPSQISDFLNFSKVQLSNTDYYHLNFNNQFNPPLLLQFSPKRIVDLLSASKALTELTELKKLLDAENLSLKGEFKAYDTVLSDLKVKLSDAENKLNQFANIDKVKLLHTEYVSVSEMLSRYTTVITCYRECIANESKIRQLAGILQTASNIIYSSGLYLKYRNLYTSFLTSKEVFYRLQLLNNTVTKVKSVIEADSILRRYVHSVTLFRELRTINTASALLFKLVRRVSLLSDVSAVYLKFNAFCTVYNESTRLSVRLCRLHNILYRISLLITCNLYRKLFLTYNSMSEVIVRITQVSRTITVTDSLIRAKHYVDTGNLLKSAVLERENVLHNIEHLKLSQEAGVCPFCGRN